MRNKAIEALRQIQDKYPACFLKSAIAVHDGVALGQIMLALYRIDEEVVDYLSTPDKQLLDADKLLSILEEV